MNMSDVYIAVKDDYACRDFASNASQAYCEVMRLKQIRISAGLTQEQLAEMAGVTQATISRLESGKDSITLRQIKNIAEALNVEPSDVIAPNRPVLMESLVERFRQLEPEKQKALMTLIDAVEEE